MELTTLLIPGFNDDDAQLHAECTWIREHLGPDVPLHFSAFHPSYRMMDVPPTPHETLTRARDIALEEGLNYVYTGNVHDREGDTTYCQTLNAGPSSWNAIGIESLPIVYLPDTVAMGTAPYAGLLSPDVGNLPQVARAIHRRSPIRAAIVLIDLRLAS